MEMKMCRLLSVPSLVRLLCREYDALIVGSGALWLLNERDEIPGDFDVVVPPRFWPVVCKLFPRKSLLNAFGGVKILNKGGYSMDIWTDDIQSYFSNLPSDDVPRVAYNPDKKLILRFEPFTGSLI